MEEIGRRAVLGTAEYHQLRLQELASISAWVRGMPEARLVAA